MPATLLHAGATVSSAPLATSNIRILLLRVTVTAQSSERRRQTQGDAGLVAFRWARRGNIQKAAGGSQNDTGCDECSRKLTVADGSAAQFEAARITAPRIGAEAVRVAVAIDSPNSEVAADYCARESESAERK